MRKVAMLAVLNLGIFGTFGCRAENTSSTESEIAASTTKSNAGSSSKAKASEVTCHVTQKYQMGSRIFDPMSGSKIGCMSPDFPVQGTRDEIVDIEPKHKLEPISLERNAILRYKDFHSPLTNKCVFVGKQYIRIGEDHLKCVKKDGSKIKFSEIDFTL